MGDGDCRVVPMRRSREELTTGANGGGEWEGWRQAERHRAPGGKLVSSAALDAALFLAGSAERSEARYGQGGMGRGSTVGGERTLPATVRRPAQSQATPANLFDRTIPFRYNFGRNLPKWRRNTDV